MCPIGLKLHADRYASFEVQKLHNEELHTMHSSPS
jgi:hypothetical protein